MTDHTEGPLAVLHRITRENVAKGGAIYEMTAGPIEQEENDRADEIEATVRIRQAQGREESRGGGVMTYTVVENTPGYLPESEPADFKEYSDAVQYANDLADELEDQGYETDRSWASRDNYYAISATNPEMIHDLGRIIEVIHLDEEEL